MSTTRTNANAPTWQLNPPYRPPQPESNAPLKASCHCGRVRYFLLRDEPLSAKLCHCRNCQVLHGAPFQWAAIFNKEDIAFETGHEHLAFYHSENTSTEHELPCKVSCSHCGSRIMDEGRNMALIFPTLIRWGEGEMEKRKKFDPQMHLFYPQRVIDIDDGKPKWEGQDDKSKLIEGKL